MGVLRTHSERSIPKAKPQSSFQAHFISCLPYIVLSSSTQPLALSSAQLVLYKWVNQLEKTMTPPELTQAFLSLALVVGCAVICTFALLFYKRFKKKRRDKAAEAQWENDPLKNR